MRDEIKVVVFGIGEVGSELVKDLYKRQGIKLVGAIDIAPQLVGQDVGVAVGCGELGVTIKESLEEVCAETKPDVVFGSAATPSNVNIARLTYEQMKPAVEHGANVIVANSNTTNPVSYTHLGSDPMAIFIRISFLSLTFSDDRIRYSKGMPVFCDRSPGNFNSILI